ncbi:hypothetical protein DMUE_5448 [Dictyocoela muelleri]|nr:hypothetical protein DMUE_5448 [Dictyocoela muelleri]
MSLQKNQQRAKEQNTLEKTCDVTFDSNNFQGDHISAFSIANIPLFKLHQSEFKGFFDKYTGKTVKDESRYLKILLPSFYSPIRKFLLDTRRDIDILVLQRFVPLKRIEER